ncbi:MAG: hypothetical protein AB3N63_19450 [Puniceicoccaceae bacterium]
MKRLVYLLSLLLLSPFAFAIEHIPASVDFADSLQLWDGFGFNYVETCQTRDYNEWEQDYGGYSLLNDKQKEEIAELVFGKNGLQVDIIKMFLDPWHQESPESGFDHTTTTSNMLRFVEDGVSLARKENREIEVITTLYGPPIWATLQGHIGGRDLDTSKFKDLAEYMIDWAKFLRERKIGVKYLSIHNEGEDFYRWTHDEGKQRLERFDYNAHWPPEQVNTFMKVLSKEVDRSGLNDLGVTNGEPSNWTRFHNWGYAHALFSDKEAMAALDLLTTHGFINGDYTKLSYSNANGSTTSMLRSERPDLHTWITSYAWGALDTRFIKMAYEHIYYAGVNALIPWAGIQEPTQWLEGDSLGNAITVTEDGEYKVTRGYYLYKQLTSAGHRGMKVARTTAANPTANLIGFSSNGTDHPDAFVLVSNIRIWGLPYAVEVKGSQYTRFRAYRTTEDGKDLYKDIGLFEVKDGRIVYDPPYGSVTTFIGQK